jgi:small subunit ribosomal protein S1
LVTSEENGKVDVAEADAEAQPAADADAEKVTAPAAETVAPEALGEEAAQAASTGESEETADTEGAIQRDEEALLEPPAEEEQAEQAPADRDQKQDGAAEVAPVGEASAEEAEAGAPEEPTAEASAEQEEAAGAPEEPTAEASAEQEEAAGAPEEPTAEAPAEAKEPAAVKKPRRRKTPLSELKAGTETTGRVVGIAKFGAFVDIGAETDGLVHISELSEKRVNKVSDVVSVGQQVDVWIKDVDTRQERISLSMKSKPKYRLKDLQTDMVVQGVVTGIRDYGAFVDIGAETEGLVHVSEMAEGYVNKPSELVSVGEEIEVRVKDVNRKRRRISLTMKGVGAAAPSATPDEAEPDMPTAMEAAMRRALGELEDEIEEEAEESTEAGEVGRDELSDVYSRMLREYRERDDEGA